MTTTISAGTVTVANGGTTVTGVNTFWEGKVFEGDLFTDPLQGLIARVTADATSNTALSINAWPGTDLTSDAYEIVLQADSIRMSERTRQLLEQMSVIQANGRGLFFLFSDTVTDADPGAGYLRLNSATIGSATAAYIDNLDANGATVADELDTWDDSTSLTKGKLWLRSIADPAVFHAFGITGSVVDGTGYRKLTLVYVGGSGSFSDSDELMAFFVPNGDAGDGFITGAEVADPAGLTAYESEAAGYLVFVTDLSTLFSSAYAGRSGVVRLIAGPAWELAALYTGPKGTTGDQGEKGWSPQLVLVADGARFVFKLLGYVGGAGTAPTVNVGDYLKDDGTWTSTIGAAANVRGPAGLNGAGTVASVVAGGGIAVDNTDPTAPIVSVNFSAAPERLPILANNVTDATNDLDLSAGSAWDSTGAVRIVCAAMTKRLDAGWAPGSNSGFRNSAAAIANATYHVFAVAKAVGAAPEYYAHTSTVVATVLAALQAESGGSAYIYARRVGSIIRAGGVILPFSQDGDNFLLLTPSNNASVVTTPTTASLVTTTVPSGLAIEAVISFRMDYISAAVAALLTSPVQVDTTPTTQIQTGTVSATSTIATSAVLLRTNTSGQIRIKATGTGATYNITTLGWNDRRGRI